MKQKSRPGLIKRQQRGWLAANKWLLLRRVSQISLLMLFLLGPAAGIWIIKGSMASSLTLDTLRLTDPLLLLQGLCAGHIAEIAAITGAAIVWGFYVLAGGRVFCAWVCPVNMVTDCAEWIRRRLAVTGSPLRLDHRVRYWILVLILVLAALTGTLVWEFINPVTMTYRGLLFGIGSAWILVLALFLFDLLIARRGWCGHLCPVGAFYGLTGSISLVRVAARRRQYCNNCMDCFSICPEPFVIKPALKGDRSSSPVILSGSCTNCGRCLDVCSQNVFSLSTRFYNESKTKALKQTEVTT